MISHKFRLFTINLILNDNLYFFVRIKMFISRYQSNPLVCKELYIDNLSRQEYFLYMKYFHLKLYMIILSRKLCISYFFHTGPFPWHIISPLKIVLKGRLQRFLILVKEKGCGWILQCVRKTAKNWHFSAGFGGTFAPDWVALFNRIEWHFSTGLGGTFQPDWVALLLRNMHASPPSVKRVSSSPQR